MTVNRGRYQLTIGHDGIEQFSRSERMLLYAAHKSPVRTGRRQRSRRGLSNTYSHVERRTIDYPVCNPVLSCRVFDVRFYWIERRAVSPDNLVRGRGGLDPNALFPLICRPSISLPKVMAPNPAAVKSIEPVPAVYNLRQSSGCINVERKMSKRTERIIDPLSRCSLRLVRHQE